MVLLNKQNKKIEIESARRNVVQTSKFLFDFNFILNCFIILFKMTIEDSV